MGRREVSGGLGSSEDSSLRIYGVAASRLQAYKRWNVVFKLTKRIGKISRKSKGKLYRSLAFAISDFSAGWWRACCITQCSCASKVYPPCSGKVVNVASNPSKYLMHYVCNKSYDSLQGLRDMKISSLLV